MRRVLRGLLVACLLAGVTTAGGTAGAADGSSDVVDDMTVELERRESAPGIFTEIGRFACPPGTELVFWSQEYVIDGELAYLEYEVARSEAPLSFADFDAGRTVRAQLFGATNAELGDFLLLIGCYDALDELIGVARIEMETIAQYFDDVAAGAFYDLPSLWAAINDVTTGTGPTTFNPSGDVSRWQMAVFLQRFADLLDTGASAFAGVDPFDDTAGYAAYQRSAIGWLFENAITTGTSPTTYSPEQPVTRWQMALFLRRFAEAVGLDTSSGLFVDTFNDTAGLSEGTRQAIAWLAANGITTGVGGGNFDPNGTVTRGQMVTFLMRLHNLLLSSETTATS